MSFFLSALLALFTAFSTGHSTSGGALSGSPVKTNSTSGGALSGSPVAPASRGPRTDSTSGGALSG